jgi:hypothetical protein
MTTLARVHVWSTILQRVTSELRRRTICAMEANSGKLMALDVPCPDCEAGVGVICTLPSGKEAQHSHYHREKASLIKRTLDNPITEGPRVEIAGSVATVWIPRSATTVEIKHID